MFPSTNYTSSSSYPRFSSSSSTSQYPSFTFLHPENSSTSNTFLHDPVTFIPSHYHAPIPETLANWAVADCAAMLNQDLGGATVYGIAKKPAKKANKKDRHSKIHTSQGLRDRRVRLSIEIARKFFDLQDMLGFDKASNTLDWLFNKSKKAIHELTQSKNSAETFEFSSSSEGEVVSMINQNLQGVDLEERKLKEPASYCGKAKMRESREKARARARERTNSKVLMCNTNSGEGKKVQELNKKCPESENPQILNQLSLPFQPYLQDAGGEVPRDDDFNVIEESIVIKRKLKHTLMSSIHHHQNVVIPKEASVNNNSDYHTFPNFSPNWDTNNGASGRSTFCTIASMNLSTGLQIFGKSWEE